MSTEWIKRKRENFPKGSMEKFLKFDGSKSIVDALKKRIPKEPDLGPKVIPLERLNDEALALAFVAQLIRGVHAKRKNNREFNP